MKVSWVLGFQAIVCVYGIPLVHFAEELGLNSSVVIQNALLHQKHSPVLNVKSLQEAAEVIRSGKISSLDIFYVEQEDLILFQYEGDLPKSSDPIAETPAEEGDALPMALGIKDWLEKLTDETEKTESILKEKITDAVPDKIIDINDRLKLRPKPSPVLAKKATWILQKAQTLEDKVVPDLVPVTPCLDSTHGDGGTISFSHGSAFSLERKVERSFQVGWIVYAKYKDVRGETVSYSYSYSVKGTISAGEKGQLFIKNPRFSSVIFKQKLLQITDVIEVLQDQEFTTRILDYSSALEYHFTTDPHHLKCDSYMF